jgi:uncharacterized protein (AIM24 family)
MFWTVAPALPGDLFSLNLVNEGLMVQSGSYVASESNVELCSMLIAKEEDEHEKQ